MISGVCYSYKEEILKGIHQIDHQYHIALYTKEAKLSPKTKIYTTSNELEAGFGYKTGGKLLENVIAFSNKGSAFLTFDNPFWEESSFTAKGALIYNKSLADKNAVAVINFDKNYSSINGKFILELSTSNKKAVIIKIT